jgi:transcriptional regulator with XRE-family HTH domain
MSGRIESRVEKRLKDPQHRAGYFGADAEIQLTEALDQVRRVKGVSQEELGQRLGVSQSAVSQFLNADDGITIQRFVEYLIALNLIARIALEPAGADVTVSPIEVHNSAVATADEDDDSTIDLFAALSRSIEASFRKSPPTRPFKRGASGVLTVVDDEDYPAIAS